MKQLKLLRNDHKWCVQSMIAQMSARNKLGVFEIQQVGPQIVAVWLEFVSFVIGDFAHQVPGLAGDDIAFAVGAAVAMNDFKTFVTIQQGIIKAFFNFMPRLFPGLAVMGHVNFKIQFAERLMQRVIALGTIQHDWIDRNTAVWVGAINKLGGSGHVFRGLEENRNQRSILPA